MAGRSNFQQQGLWEEEAKLLGDLDSARKLSGEIRPRCCGKGGEELELKLARWGNGVA